MITVNYGSGRETSKTKCSNAAARASEKGRKRGCVFALSFLFSSCLFSTFNPANLCLHCRGVTYCPSGARRARGKGNHVLRASLSERSRVPSNLSNAKRAKELLGDFNEAKGHLRFMSFAKGRNYNRGSLHENPACLHHPF